MVRVAFDREGIDAVLDELAREVSPRILRAPARLDVAAHELDEYFDGRRRAFDLPLDLRLSHGFRRTVLMQPDPDRLRPHGQLRRGRRGGRQSPGGARGRLRLPHQSPAAHRALPSGGAQRRVHRPVPGRRRGQAAAAVDGGRRVTRRAPSRHPAVRIRTWTLLGADRRPYQSPVPGTLGGHRRQPHLRPPRLPGRPASHRARWLRPASGVLRRRARRHRGGLSSVLGMPARGVSPLEGRPGGPMTEIAMDGGPVVGDDGARPLSVGRRRPAQPRLPRPGMGPARPRRERPVRAHHARGVPVGAQLADHPAQAAGIPDRVRGLRGGCRGDVHRRRCRPADGRCGHRAQPGQDPGHAAQCPGHHRCPVAGRPRRAHLGPSTGTPGRTAHRSRTCTPRRPRHGHWPRTCGRTGSRSWDRPPRGH